jgi:hypothetical protein
LAEACRAWEDTVETFRLWLEAHPEQHHRDEDDGDIEDPAWVWDEWKLSPGVVLENSSRRIKDAEKDATWVGVPAVSFPDPFLTMLTYNRNTKTSTLKAFL